MGDAEENKPSRFELLLEYYLQENRRKTAEDSETKRLATLREGLHVSLPGEQFGIPDRPRRSTPISFGIPSHGGQPFVSPTTPVLRSSMFANSKWDTVPNQHVSSPSVEDSSHLTRAEAPYSQPTQPTTTSHFPSGNEDLEPKEPSISVKRRHCTCSVGEPCELAAEKGVEDCRSVVPQKSIRRKQSSANPFTDRVSITVRNPNRNTRRVGDALRVISTFRQVMNAAPADITRIINRMREELHDLQFSTTPSESDDVLRKYLDANSGLPALVNSSVLPWDIKLDAEVLLHRWESGDVSPFLDRGVITRQTSSRAQSGFTGVSRVIDPIFEHRISANFEGEGHLRNGQWWPWRITAVRDGAHGEYEAGISGYNGTAVSIVLTKGDGKSYRNIDRGDTIEYCGTAGKGKDPSAATKLMFKARDKGTPIRVIRNNASGEAEFDIRLNPYMPLVGLRYDGLYTIVGHERLSKHDAPSMFRFTLRRCPGQTPIRYRGVERRPTDQEIKEFRDIKGNVHAAKPPSGTKRKR